MSEKTVAVKSTSTHAFRLSHSEKLIIRYSVVYIISFVIGLIGYYLVTLPYSDGLVRYINSYFSYTFNPEKSIADNTVILFAVSFADIKTMAYIFVAGFTMFSSIAIYWILITEALSLGFSSLYLVNSMAAGVLQKVSFFDLVLFLFSSAAISSLLILYSSKTRIFNEEYRNLGPKKTKIIKYKPLYIQIFILLTLCGGIILINTIRFLFNIF